MNTQVPNTRTCGPNWTGNPEDRSRRRSPNLSARDRILAGSMALLVRPTCLLRSAIVLKPSTLLALHKAMSKQKYRMLFSPNPGRKPGPKGPSEECDL